MAGAERKILLTGYASDIAAITERIAGDVVLVDENASGNDLPATADVVVFALSRDACYSSQLKSVCVYVFDHVRAANRYLLPIGDVDLSALAYPEIAHLPRVTQEDLARYFPNR